MKNTLLLISLLFPHVALSDQVVVLGLVLEVVEIYFLIGFLIVLFKEHHVLFKVIFVFFHIFQNLFLVFSRVKNFILHFGVLLVGFNFCGSLQHILKFAANKEFPVNGAK
jgi:hypothetical protein